MFTCHFLFLLSMNKTLNGKIPNVTGLSDLHFHLDGGGIILVLTKFVQHLICKKNRRKDKYTIYLIKKTALSLNMEKKKKFLVMN